LKISALDGGDEAKRLARLLAKMIAKAGARRDCQTEALDEDGLAYRIQGPRAQGFLHEAGLHKFVTASGKNGKKHTSFCKIEVLQAPDSASAPIHECDIDFKAQKCGGPGGQHVNKTESAMRATHRPTGISVLCQSERSQHENKRIAIAWLAAKIEQSAKDSAASGKRQAWADSTRHGAGSPTRSYWLVEDRALDQPSGQALRASDVLAGGCVDFWSARNE
jgi:protein subunit release factor B